MPDAPQPDDDILVQAPRGEWCERALFPLGTVLFPDGLLALKVFEARYLDLIGRCLREGSAFGVVTLSRGGEVRQDDEAVAFAEVGCLAELLGCDSEQAGILHVRCRGGRRFELRAPRQRADGLWLAETRLLSADEVHHPAPEMMGSVAALGRAIAALGAQGPSPFLEPYRLDDAGWVANRWCELLPIPLATRQKLMALPDAAARLALVDGFLRRHGIVKD
ncbi:MAG: LON peptidase substrate-binding domain-containing protein [Burkholderiaceae bacterium]|nr:LON peptidase substrate-binding domain-containing protein [Burkholderiaceae bacterium]